MLELIALVFLRLSRIYQIERLAIGGQEQTQEGVLRTHEAIAAAIEAGDSDLARDRMRRHLEAPAT